MKIWHVSQLKLCHNEIFQGSLQGRRRRHEPAVQRWCRVDAVVYSTGSTKERRKKVIYLCLLWLAQNIFLVYAYK